MGAWGYSVFENDAAQEIVARWAEWTDGPGAIGNADAVSRFFSHWGDAAKYGDPTTNSEIIALLGIHLRDEIDVPVRLRDAAVRAISTELEPTALNAWGDPREREAVLREVLRRIGAEPVKPKRPKSYDDPALYYGSITAARDDLLARAERMSETGSEPFRARNCFMRDDFFVAPIGLRQFFISLHRLMCFRIWGEDDASRNLARIERSMMLASYVGARSRMSMAEIEELLDKVIASHRKPR